MGKEYYELGWFTTDKVLNQNDFEKTWYKDYLICTKYEKKDMVDKKIKSRRNL